MLGIPKKRNPAIKIQLTNQARNGIHPFYSKAQLLSKTIKKIPEYHWYECILPLSFFLDERITRLLKFRLYAVTRDAQLHIDSTVALHDGKLVLNLNKDDYEILGLTGKQSRVKNRHVVTINLLDPEFRKGNKFYDRVEWCFGNTLTSNFSFLIAAWDPGTIELIR